MAIGQAWAEGAWVDASWEVGAWEPATEVKTIGGTSQLGGMSSTGGLTVVSTKTIGGTSQLGAFTSTGTLTVVGPIIIPPAVIPGIPGPVRLLAPWNNQFHWVNPDLTIAQRTSTWIKRVETFEGRIGANEAELDVIDALITQIQLDILINAADIVLINDQITEINARLDALEDSGIIETNEAYQVLVGNKIINCSGTFNVTLVNIADAVGPVTITSVAGTITMVADAAIQGSPSITTGTSATVYPARGQWFQI